MENQQNEQIKIEVKDTTKESINYVSTDIKVNEKTDISELVGMLQSGTSEPSNKPTTLYGQIKIDSANNKVYFYDAVIGDWVTIGGTTTLQQYQTYLTEDNNTTDATPQTYSQTINCGFKPHTLYFFGALYYNGHFTINGMALRNASTTTGTSCYVAVGGATSMGKSTTNIGVGTTGYFSVTWTDTGVTISKTLLGIYSGTKMIGTIVLIG